MLAPSASLPRSTDQHLHAWDEAFRRVESYLRAHGIESRVQLNALATDIIATAQHASAQDGAEPVTLAMRETEQRIGTWFEHTLRPDGLTVSDERFQARGRLALILADVPGRWPQHFLSKNPPPDEVVQAMNGATVQAGPEVRFTNMGAQPLETLPPPNIGGGPSTFGRTAFMRAAVTWMVIIGLLGVTWAASH